MVLPKNKKSYLALIAAASFAFFFQKAKIQRRAGRGVVMKRKRSAPYQLPKAVS
jgi:hypothetical protein